MAIGAQPTSASLNGIAGNLAVTLRNTCASIISYNAYIQWLGRAGLTALGFSGTEADSLLAIFAKLSAYAVAYQGGAYAGPAFPHNFVSDTVCLCAGG